MSLSPSYSARDTSEAHATFYRISAPNAQFSLQSKTFCASCHTEAETIQLASGSIGISRPQWQQSFKSYIYSFNFIAPSGRAHYSATVSTWDTSESLHAPAISSASHTTTPQSRSRAIWHTPVIRTSRSITIFARLRIAQSSNGYLSSVVAVLIYHLTCLQLA